MLLEESRVGANSLVIGKSAMRVFFDTSLLKFYACRDRQEDLMVVAPSKGDILRLFPNALVETIGNPEDALYRYSAHIPREDAAKVFSSRIREIR